MIGHPRICPVARVKSRAGNGYFVIDVTAVPHLNDLDEIRVQQGLDPERLPTLIGKFGKWSFSPLR